MVEWVKCTGGLYVGIGKLLLSLSSILLIFHFFAVFHPCLVRCWQVKHLVRLRKIWLGLKETHSQLDKMCLRRKHLPHAFLYSLFPRWQSYGITTTWLVSYKEGHEAILITVFKEPADIGKSPFATQSDNDQRIHQELLFHTRDTVHSLTVSMCTYSVHENHRVGVKVPAGVESNYVWLSLRMQSDPRIGWCRAAAPCIPTAQPTRLPKGHSSQSSQCIIKFPRGLQEESMQESRATEPIPRLKTHHSTSSELWPSSLAHTVFSD